MRRALSLFVVCGISALALAQDRPGDDGQAGSGARQATEPQSKPEGAKVTAETATSPLDFTMRDIDGKQTPLSKYKGKVVLIVNVASKCGFTPQYEQLQDLHEKYAEKGLAVLGFPANDFRKQEPGTNEQIKQFCTKRFGVTFDMFSKIVVKGDGQCELYKFLTSPRTNPDFAGPIKWNFTKFLIGRDGKTVARFEPRTRPDDPDVIQAIEKALAAEPPEDD
jgi:glutathione peroxidase